jgi:hypothetical protein
MIIELTEEEAAYASHALTRFAANLPVAEAAVIRALAMRFAAGLGDGPARRLIASVDLVEGDIPAIGEPSRDGRIVMLEDDPGLWERRP